LKRLKIETMTKMGVHVRIKNREDRMKMRNATLKGIVLASALGFATGTFAAPTLWIDDASGNLGTVDVTTGNVNYIGNMGSVMTDIAFDPTGQLYGISSSALYQINTSTAAATMVGSFGAAAAMSSTTINSLVFSSSGTLYAAGSALFTLNTSSGAASFVGFGPSFMGGIHSSGDLAFVGGKLYLSDDYYGYDRLVVVDPNNPSSSSTTYPVNYPYSGSYITDGSTYYQSVFGLATPDNTKLYGVDGTTILDINKSTGFATVLTNYAGYGLGAANGTAFYTEAGATVAAVPEPESYAMILAGLGLLGFMARRRKQKDAA
jgi:hypothetical protein